MIDKLLEWFMLHPVVFSICQLFALVLIGGLYLVLDGISDQMRKFR